MTYRPNQWVVIKFDNDLYKVFGFWPGGYLGSDSWRLNSGIESIEETEDTFEFKGYSGSVYICQKHSYGVSNAYARAVISSLSEKAQVLSYEEVLAYVSKE